jgi:hypothetical protein
MKAAFQDAWEAVGVGDGFTYSSDRPVRRIDYVFHSPGLTPVRAWVPSSLASDHLPLDRGVPLARGEGRPERLKLLPGGKPGSSFVAVLLGSQLSAHPELPWTPSLARAFTRVYAEQPVILARELEFFVDVMEAGADRAYGDAARWQHRKPYPRCAARLRSAANNTRNQVACGRSRSSQSTPTFLRA